MIYIPIGLVVVGFLFVLKDLGSLEKQIFRIEDALERLEKKIQSPKQ